MILPPEATVKLPPELTLKLEAAGYPAALPPPLGQTRGAS